MATTALALTQKGQMSLTETDLNQIIVSRTTVTDAALVATILTVFEGVKRGALGRLKPLILEVETPCGNRCEGDDDGYDCE